jgi:hypothetical protein
MEAALLQPQSTAIRIGGLRFAPSTLRLRNLAPHE